MSTEERLTRLDEQIDGSYRCQGCGGFVEPDPVTPEGRGHVVANSDGSPGYCGPVVGSNSIIVLRNEARWLVARVRVLDGLLREVSLSGVESETAKYATVQIPLEVWLEIAGMVDTGE